MTTTKEALDKAWLAYIAAVDSGDDLQTAGAVLAAADKASADAIRARMRPEAPKDTACPVCLSKDFGNGELMHRPRCPVLKQEEGQELA